MATECPCAACRRAMLQTLFGMRSLSARLSWLLTRTRRASCSYSNCTEIEGIGAITVGVSKADGQKCQR